MDDLSPKEVMKLVDESINRGNLLEFLKDNYKHFCYNYCLTSKIVRKAVNHSNYSVLEWINDNGPMHGYDISYVCLFTAQKGDLQMLKWLRERNVPWNNYTCAAAAEFGHYELFVWAYENGCPVNDKTIMKAAEHGHLEIIEFLFFKKYNITSFSIAPAAKKASYRVIYEDNDYALIGNAQFNVLMWAASKGIYFDEHAYNFAAEGGNLQMLEWFKRCGIPFSSSLMMYAVMNNHLNVIEWAWENNCPWCHSYVKYIKSETHPHIMNWVRVRNLHMQYGNKLSVTKSELDDKNFRNKFYF